MYDDLSIDLRALLNGQVESERMEFKATWDEKVTPSQIIKVVCAFSNDFYNHNGGWIFIGVAEHQGRAILPGSVDDPKPHRKPLAAEDLDDIQNQIRGLCNGKIDPSCVPRMYPRLFEDHPILAIRVPGSEQRPHRASAQAGSKDKNPPYHYYIRNGAATIALKKGPQLQALLALGAKVPFDDRLANGCTLDDVNPALVRAHLKEINSNLLAESDDKVIYRSLELSKPINSHEGPRNVALLLFSHEMQRFFPAARIEVVSFSDESGTNLIETVFRGPLIQQLRDCLRFLGSEFRHFIRKQPDKAEAESWEAYPLAAVEEVLTNAVYHRSYEPDNREPTKVYVYPGRMEIISYPGPVPGIEERHFADGVSVPKLALRNRRLGGFFQEVNLAEMRCTGIPQVFQKMKENGSPPPEFEVDEHHFSVTLRIHPLAVGGPEKEAQPRHLLLLIQYDGIITAPASSDSTAVRLPARADTDTSTLLRHFPLERFKWRQAIVELEDAIRQLRPTEWARVDVYVAAPFAIAAWVGRLLEQHLRDGPVRLHQRLLGSPDWVVVDGSDSAGGSVDGPRSSIQTERASGDARVVVLALEGRVPIRAAQAERLAAEVNAGTIIRFSATHGSAHVTQKEMNAGLALIRRELLEFPSRGIESVHVIATAPNVFLIEVGRLLSPQAFRRAAIYDFYKQRSEYYPVLDLCSGDLLSQP